MRTITVEDTENRWFQVKEVCPRPNRWLLFVCRTDSHNVYMGEFRPGTYEFVAYTIDCGLDILKIPAEEVLWWSFLPDSPVKQ